MTPYAWGLLAVALGSYVLGVVRFDRLPSQLFHRFALVALTRHGSGLRLRASALEQLPDLAAWNARRRLRVRLIRPHRAEHVLDQCELGRLVEHVLGKKHEGDPLGAPDRRFSLFEGDVMLVELAGVTDLEPVAELARFEVMR